MDSEYIEVEEVTNGMQVMQQDKAMIDMQIATAKRYPRDIERSIRNAIAIVTMDKEIAESCNYSITKGGKNITGPSVVLAKILAQSMGNIRIENRVVGFDTTHVTCEAVCFDLETNFAIRTQIKKSIVGKTGRYSEDMCTIVGNAGNSIALRNAIFAVIPKQIVDKVYNSAKEKVIGKLSTATELAATVSRIFEGFKKSFTDMKFTDTEICSAVGKTSVKHITKEDILTYVGFEKSFASGEVSPESVFRKVVGGGVPMPKSEEKEQERMLLLIRAATDKSSLEKLKDKLKTNEERTEYDKKFKELKN